MSISTHVRFANGSTLQYAGTPNLSYDTNTLTIGPTKYGFDQLDQIDVMDNATILSRLAFRTGIVVIPGAVMKIGQRGKFRPIDSVTESDWKFGVVVKHGDETLITNGPPIYGVSADYPGGAMSKIYQFNADGTLGGGFGSSPGAWERVTFDGLNLMNSRRECGTDGSGPTRAFTWVNL